MYNLNIRKYPSHPTVATHKVFGNKFFIQSEENLPPFQLAIDRNTKTLDNVDVTLLDYGLGYNGLWSRIYVHNADGTKTLGYVMTSGLVENPDVKLNPLFQYNPDNNLASKLVEGIDWKKVTPLTSIDDEKNGSRIVVWEFPEVTSFENVDLNEKLAEAYDKGIKFLLSEQGYSLKQQDKVNKLLYGYYAFARAEEFSIDPRPCSCLKVLVAISKRFLLSSAIDLNRKQQDEQYEDLENTILNEETGQTNEENTGVDPVVYIEKKFNNFKEFKKFFCILGGTIATYNSVLEQKEWDLGEATLNFQDEFSNLKKYFKIIGQFIRLNSAKSFVTEDKIADLIANTSAVDLESSIEKFSLQIIPNDYAEWRGELTLVINPKNYSIANIKYNLDGKPVSLNKQLLTFLKNETIQNGTIVNYFVSFMPDNDGPRDGNRQILLENWNNNTFGLFDMNDSTSLKGAFTVYGGVAPFLTDTYDGQMQIFLKEKHYPSIEATPLGLDIENCITTQVQYLEDIARDKLPEAAELYAKAKQKAIDEQPKTEANVFSKSLLDLSNVVDPNFRILFGLDEPPGENKKQRFFNYVAVAQSLDWAKYLAFASQCLSKKINPNDYQEIIKKYGSAKKFIENLLLATLCNPFLTNGLKTINGFQIPAMQTNNSMQALAEAIQQAIIDLLKEVVQEGIKAALKAAADACVDDPNADYGGAAPAEGEDPFENPLSSALEDPDLNDLLGDIFSDLKDNNDLLDDNAKQEAKDKLKNLLDDISSCLSANEFCRLLKGYSVNDEVIQFIMALAKRKFGPPLSNRFNNKEYIYRFFKTLGSKLDLTICEDILNSEVPKTANLLCDDGKLQNLRRKILEDTSLPKDAIDDLLNALKEKEKKDLEKVLALLNSDNPFDFSKAPDLLCSILPNGQTIAPPKESYNKVINALFDPVYTKFNEEAEEWYTTTYSLSSSAPQMMEFDEATGQFKIKQTESTGALTDIIKASFESDPEKRKKANSFEAAAAVGGGGGGTSGVKYPSYMFKDTFQNNNYYLNYSSNQDVSVFNFTASLNGYKQQKLDAALIGENLRNKVIQAEKPLKDAVSKLLFYFNAKFVVEVGKLIPSIEDVAGQSSVAMGFLEAFKSLGGIADFVRVLDMYVRGNIVNLNEPILANDLDAYYKLLGFDGAQEAAAMYSSEKGVPIYYLIASTFFDSSGQLKPDLGQFINYVTTINTGENNSTNSNLELADGLVSDFLKAGILYKDVKNYYSVVLNTLVTYPNYDVVLNSSLSSLEIPLNKQIILEDQQIKIGDQTNDTYKLQTYFNNNLYDIYSLEVKKNGNNHLKISETIPVSNNILSYIRDSLEIKSLENIKKHDIYNSFINLKLEDYNSVIIENSREEIILSSNELPSDEGTKQIIRQDSIQNYENAAQYIFNNIKSNILSTNTKTNKFLFLKSLETGTIPNSVVALDSGSGGIPYTKFLKLVIPPTQNQILCNARPHYLDIDNIKQDTKKEQQRNNCADMIIDEKIAKGLPIDPKEIEEIETDESQKIMSKGIYQLAIRLFLHDLILRSIPVFGYYDPQTLRDEKLFSDFLSDMVEIEMRGMDNTFFRMLSNYVLKVYLKQNPLKQDEKITESKKIDLRRKALRAAVREELKSAVLPKLAKRIDIDTNIDLVNSNPKDKTIKLVDVYDDIQNFNQYIKFYKNSIYIKINNQQTIKSTQTYYVKIFESNNSDPNKIWMDFISTTEHDLLFKYLFPVTQYLTTISITSILATSTRRQIVDAFRDTKKKLIRVAKSVQSNGREISFDPMNPQDMENSNPLNEIWKFILTALLKTPYNIAKAFAEGTEPNLAIITTVFKLARAFEPRLPSLLIPAASIPAALLPPPIGFLPAVNPILFWVYHATLMWYDDPYKDILESSKQQFFDQLSGDNMSNVNCDDVINQDRFYLDKNNKAVTIEPISGKYDLYYGKGYEAGTLKSIQEILQDTEKQQKARADAEANSANEKLEEEKSAIIDKREAKNNPKNN